MPRLCQRKNCPAIIGRQAWNEGVEYSWAFSKMRYRRQPMKRKKGRENFKELVRECHSNDVLTKSMANSFAARARSYILTYYWLHRQQEQRRQFEGEEDNRNISEVQQAHFIDLERMRKNFSTHRTAIDFDAGFMNAFFREKPSS